MNTHENARLTYLRRLELVQDITLRGLSAAEAAAEAGVSAVTARKWLGRFLANGAQALLDKTSRPAVSPRAIDPGVAVAIVELRRKLYLQNLNPERRFPSLFEPVHGSAPDIFGQGLPTPSR